MDRPGDADDAELVRAHAAGDPEAFGELFRRHRDRLWAVALRTLGDPEEAADALQDALLSTHRAAARFRGDSAVTTWLHRIVVNACLDRFRRRRAHPTVPLPEQSAQRGELAAPLPDHDTALVVQQALAQLPIEQRAAIVLVDLQGYSIAEVAAIFEVAEGTIKSRCARGRTRLATLLGHLNPARAGSTNPEGKPESDPASNPGGNPESDPAGAGTGNQTASDTVSSRSEGGAA